MNAHLGDFEYFVVHVEHALDLAGQVAQADDDLLASLLLRVGVLAHDQTEHDERDELAGVGLGRGDADLRAGVDVNAAVGLARYRAAHRVRDADDESAALLAVAQRQYGVGRLARLRDEEAHVVAEDGRVAVEEVAGQLDHDGQLGELLEQLASGDGAVIARAARDEHEATAALDLADEVLDAAECDLELIGAGAHATAHRVHHRLGLLEDLLLHEVLVVALHDLLDLEQELVYLAMRRLVVVAALDAMDGEATVAHHGHVVVLQEDHLIGVLDDGARVRGEKVLDVLVRAERMVLGLHVRIGSRHRRLQDRATTDV